MGGGLEIEAEVTDFVIILNKHTAVEAFSKGGNLTIGGNMTVAAGPLGKSNWLFSVIQPSVECSNMKNKIL